MQVHHGALVPPSVQTKVGHLKHALTQIPKASRYPHLFDLCIIAKHREHHSLIKAISIPISSQNKSVFINLGFCFCSCANEMVSPPV